MLQKVLRKTSEKQRRQLSPNVGEIARIVRYPFISSVSESSPHSIVVFLFPFRQCRVLLPLAGKGGAPIKQWSKAFTPCSIAL